MAGRPPTSNTPYGSFLGLQPGLDSRQALVTQKRKDQLKEFQDSMEDQAAAVPVESRGMFMQFARIGDALGQKLGGGSNQPALTPEEDRSLRILENSNQKIKELRQTPEFQSLDPMEQSFQSQKIVADAAAEAGDYDAYAAMSSDLYNKRLQKRTGDAQMKVLEGEADVAENKADLFNKQATADMNALDKGLPAQMVRMVDGKPDLNEPVTVLKGVDGVMRDEDGNEVSYSDVMHIDDALALDTARSKRGEGAFTANDLVKLNGVGNMNALRTGLDDIEIMSEVSERLVGAMEEASDPQKMVGKQGGLMLFASDMFNLVVGTGKNVRVFATVDENGKGVGKGRSLEEAADKFIKDDWVPNQFRKDATAALKYKSAVMQMVYATARLEETGSARLSDQDIKNAMETLGVNSGDPLAVLATLQANVHGRLSTAQSKYARLGGQIEAWGLPLDETYKRVLGQNPDVILDRARNALHRPNTVQKDPNDIEARINQAVDLGLSPEDNNVLDYYRKQ